MASCPKCGKPKVRKRKRDRRRVCKRCGPLPTSSSPTLDDELAAMRRRIIEAFMIPDHLLSAGPRYR